jgi:hypothetical protein
MDIGGSLRSIAPSEATYIGVDMEEGNGVDQVLSDPYSYPFDNETFDAIVSTSCWEHDPMFWLTFLEGLRVLSPNGFMYINAPSSGAYHHFPLDYWRFYPDAGIGLEMWASRMSQPVRLVESFLTGMHVNSFNDCVMVFTKDQKFRPERYIQDIRDEVFNARKGTVQPFLANKSSVTNLQLHLRTSAGVETTASPYKETFDRIADGSTARVSVLRSSDGPRPFNLANVPKTTWAYYEFNVDCCQLHPTEAAHDPAELSVSVPLDGQSLFTCEVSVESPHGFSVDFSLEIMETASNRRSAMATITVRPGERKPWRVPLAAPASGTHTVILRTVMASGAQSNHQVKANWLAPALVLTPA